MNQTSRVKVLIINRDQFGYHTDTYMYSKYLDERYAITYVCIDSGRPRIQVDDCEVIYSKRRFAPGKLGRFLGFILAIISFRKSHDVYFIKQFSGSFLLRLFIPRARAVLDIRTLAISVSKYKRLSQDALIKLDTRAFSTVTVVSTELGNKIGVPEALEIPLGCEITSGVKYGDGSIRDGFLEIIYVGTLIGRKLETVIAGLAQHELSNPSVRFRLSIVGDGFPGQRQQLQAMVDSLGLSSSVEFLGYLKGSDLVFATQRADYGLVHVPNEERYSVQPSTKLFEYWAWGLPIIGTRYPMNDKYFEAGLGILYDDHADGFAYALKRVADGLETLPAHQIVAHSQRYSWSNVVKSYLEPVLELVVSQQQ